MSNDLDTEPGDMDILYSKSLLDLVRLMQSCPCKDWNPPKEVIEGPGMKELRL